MPSRLDDHDQGSAQSALFDGHQRHVMIHSARRPIALSKNSQPSSQGNRLVSRSSKLFAVNQGPHTLPFVGPEKIPNRSPPSSYFRHYLWLALSTSSPIHQAKPIGQESCSGLVQSIFSSPARLDHVPPCLHPLSPRRQAKNALHNPRSGSQYRQAPCVLGYRGLVSCNST
jgi:hypothetical protein